MLSRWITAFQTDPKTMFISLAIEIPAFLLALILHEISHGYAALWCGDGTAKMMGRLSLRPSHHLDPIGSLCMVLLGFGWAKPVPVNPRNFRSYVRDDFLVSIAGIMMNLFLFIISTVILTVLTKINLVYMNSAFSFLSCQYTGFYLIYTYTGDPETAMFFKYEWLLYIQHFFAYFSLLNLVLAVFNFLPIPPLDGFHIFNDILLKGKLRLTPELFRVCQIGLIVICHTTGIITRIISAVQNAIQPSLVSGLIHLFGMG